MTKQTFGGGLEE